MKQYNSTTRIDYQKNLVMTIPQVIKLPQSVEPECEIIKAVLQHNIIDGRATLSVSCYPEGKQDKTENIEMNYYTLNGEMFCKRDSIPCSREEVMEILGESYYGYVIIYLKNPELMSSKKRII